jgi:hypothetical protein
VARVARVPLADLADPANRFRTRHRRATSARRSASPAWSSGASPAGLLDAILEAAGLALPWDATDVRPLPALGARRPQLPGTLDPVGDEDAAAPTVADPAPDGPPTSTVPPR